MLRPSLGQTQPVAWATTLHRPAIDPVTFTVVQPPAPPLVQQASMFYNKVMWIGGIAVAVGLVAVLLRR